MHISYILLLACVLGLAQAGTWRKSQDSSLNDEESRASWTHKQSDMWPRDVADFPEANLLIHKVEKRLERVHNNDQLKSQVVDYVVNQLRQCKTGNEMDEHCVKRSIGYAMSFINRHQYE
ncbi:uncharacterized protein LOC6568621 [Drosophila grimshawi]|uniref:GH17072 n=1 Tax=Drosophila grimshawi TaxID=7222 RepID=B4JU85_DROGR|nr:uncharacterized protein LOC6568621 [Drosophila grimshawi]EDV91055.1 GH17072 [Drosophila grimshawi]